MADHLIGLLLGAEEDWPRAFETVLDMVGPVDHGGEKHTLSTERLTIEPFRLDARVRTPLVIDRLAYWYYHPREWLKKAALVNGTYLLNSPFTFQAMEKHWRTAPCSGSASRCRARSWCPTRTRSTTCAGPTPRRSTTR